jgi:anti-sigma regulatory factor (Ser/Thr protein kinase)
VNALQLRSRAEVPAIPKLRGEVVAYAEQVGADEAVREKVRLAVSEAVTNCVVHAYPEQAPGDVTVKAWVGDDGQLVIVVSDDGSGFRTSPINPGLGIGLGLMAEMSDGLSIGTRDGQPGTSVTLRFGISGP